jgi:ribosome-associated protein
MATRKKLPAKKAAKKPAPRKASFKASGPGGRTGGPKAGGKGPKVERKLPRKHGPRRKTPRSVGREAAPAPAPVRDERPDESRATAVAVAQAGLDKKAEDVTVFDVRGLSSYADYLVIMTADSDRQASAIADSVDDKMKEAGHAKIAVEGYETGTWIIVDYGDVVAHVMNRDSRGFYDLDGLWADAPRFTVEG